MFGIDTGAGVMHTEHGVATGLPRPLHFDAAIGGRVAHRIAHQVGQRTVQLGAAAGNLARVLWL